MRVPWVEGRFPGLHASAMVADRLRPGHSERRRAMALDEILKQVDPIWHEEFRRYVTTGKASDGFLRYYEANPACQEAADAALVALFSPFAEALRKDESDERQRTRRLVP